MSPIHHVCLVFRIELEEYVESCKVGPFYVRCKANVSSVNTNLIMAKRSLFGLWYNQNDILEMFSFRVFPLRHGTD